jgi:hypothetical protein
VELRNYIKDQTVYKAFPILPYPAGIPQVSTFEVVITSVCETATIFEPTPIFERNEFWFVKHSPTKFREFDHLRDSVGGARADGSFFCGPRGYSLEIKMFEKHIPKFRITSNGAAEIKVPEFRR